MTAEPLVVIGIGQDGPRGLGPAAHAHLAHASILAGSRRQLAFFPGFAGRQILLEGNPSDWMLKLKARDAQQRTVVLATGDPLFYGIGRVLLASFPKEELLFVPRVSSMALAFARLKTTWNDACIVSLHGRPLETLLPALKRGEPKIGIFTDAANHPAAIAQLVCKEGLGSHYVLWVCENLGSDHERTSHWSAAQLYKEDFAPLNVVVLLAEPQAQPKGGNLPLLGIPESAILHRGAPDGLITKRAIRLQALCELELHHGDVFWDVGAGSGSVSLEAARLSSSLAVFTIEKAADALAYLRANLDNFHLDNIRLIAGEAPECFIALPDPDAVFVGGNGGQLLAILDRVLDRLQPGGRLVLSCIALETFTQAWGWFSERGLQPQATSLQLAHSRPLGSLHCLEPEHPIFLLRVKKP